MYVKNILNFQIKFYFIKIKQLFSKIVFWRVELEFFFE